MIGALRSPGRWSGNGSDTALRQEAVRLVDPIVDAHRPARQQGMDYWKRPHSKIISATPGFEEYRQIHLAETNPGLWPAVPGVETAIPADRRIDGIAEVTFNSVLSPLWGRKQTKLAYKDEVNVFRRTLLSTRGRRTRLAGTTSPSPESGREPEP